MEAPSDCILLDVIIKLLDLFDPDIITKNGLNFQLKNNIYNFEIYICLLRTKEYFSFIKQ